MSPCQEVSKQIIRSVSLSTWILILLLVVFATYYFTGIATADGPAVVPVANPTLKSAKRALTTSFGSIAFGSLIIALIQTLRGILSSVRRNAQDNGNRYAAVSGFSRGARIGL